MFVELHGCRAYHYIALAGLESCHRSIAQVAPHLAVRYADRSRVRYTDRSVV